MFTLAEGFMLGCVTATYDVNEVGPNQLIKIFLAVMEIHAVCWCRVQLF
jgi:hypothetical protein